MFVEREIGGDPIQDGANKYAAICVGAYESSDSARNWDSMLLPTTFSWEY